MEECLNCRARITSKELAPIDESAVAMQKSTRQLGCVFSGYGAAEVDFAEELQHTETNPMCSIHQRRRTSCWHSRPKSIVWNDLPR